MDRDRHGNIRAEMDEEEREGREKWRERGRDGRRGEGAGEVDRDRHGNRRAEMDEEERERERWRETGGGTEELRWRGNGRFYFNAEEGRVFS